MKKNLRVVQISGFKGLFFAFFIISCLIAGFIAFPAFVTMNGWNYLALKTGSFPSINFGQGILLWAIIAFSCFIANKKRFIISFSSKQELTDAEVKDVVSRIKSQTLNHQILMPKDFSIPKETKEEIEVQPEHKEG